MQQPPGAAPQVRILTIESERAGQRLDNYLFVQLKGVPRSLIYRLLRTGQVRVNGGRAKPHYRLQSGDAVRVPPVRSASREAPRPDARRVRELLEAVLYEDQALLVIDKPSGLTVHGGTGVRHGIIETLRAGRYPELELVHRLDKETSGCLLLAKRRGVLRQLHQALREGGLRKQYLTLVAGHWRRPETVTLPLQPRGAGAVRQAVTNFEPLEFLADTTLMRVRLLTGRTHQIRLHAAACGHPVAGDARYGDFGFNRRMREVGLKRLFLHAASVACEHAGGFSVEAPLPAALQDVLARLRRD